MAEGLPAHLVCRPQISLIGEVNEAMARDLHDGLHQWDGTSDLGVEITTPGGDAELGRRMVLDVTLARNAHEGRIIFLGKTEIYSAGVTLMSAFPRADRYLSSDAVLLIHCRQLEKTVELSGPIRASLPKLDAVRRQIEVGVRLENDNFARLIEGSDVGMEELEQKAISNWYVTAQEALDRGLVAGLF